MSQYRKISMPKCPYCKVEVQYKLGDYDTNKLVRLATGTGSSDVTIKCKSCGKEYRVTCNIRFFSRKLENKCE